MTGRYDNTKRNQYNSTPRKVFDTYIDRMAVKRTRDREDHRADMQALIMRLKNLENQLELLAEHVQQHCHVLNEEGEDDLEARAAQGRGSEELG